MTIKMQVRSGVSKLSNKGFTLIEVLVVIGIIAVLASVVLVAINPGRQFKQARDTQRISGVHALLNAVTQNIAENRGVFKCYNAVVELPATSTVIASTSGIDLHDCLVPAYLSTLPFDPNATGAFYTDKEKYNTKYTIMKDPLLGRVTVAAIGEITSDISVTR